MSAGQRYQPPNRRFSLSPSLPLSLCLVRRSPPPDCGGGGRFCSIEGGCTACKNREKGRCGSPEKKGGVWVPANDWKIVGFSSDRRSSRGRWIRGVGVRVYRCGCACRREWWRRSSVGPPTPVAGNMPREERELM
ncbi:hypothetical protein HanXRQr2_Chr11g0506751 [Helianthus annuus]|uniref:Uncharacterized protein n=1 Tax=Helianthus annuus TaxID=4232 RepID=A0A9K3N1D4_HELAN|nr:hypothetical protein HanXRQr2_Chr11g0506751 [Helianthus annuus]KAJ0518624.1 hypothetical protein HanHA89_Chr11g0439561 [Helianthus annuus]KAJ0686668.1 hypothetical protein HanLR1_Chr11g0417341 [Helianthus annuus]KAJ0690480.1 hypothetical protein HanOQP8_Chr11g0418311 [Helianthus annuus]KAJ0876429.1 hypothetical protein HanPSC8_Chr11g0488371 [Helianthus annuus]